MALIDAIKLKLDEEKERRIHAEAQLQALKSVKDETEKHIQKNFEILSTKTFENNSESFLRLARQILDKYITKAGEDLKHNKVSLAGMIDPLKQSLAKHEQLVHTLQEQNSVAYGSLKTWLETLNNQQLRLEKETSSLVTALKAPKIRGRWGEIGLRRIVEFSGLSQYCDFTEQQSVNTDDGKLRPDMVVNLPDNKKIVVDSKVPLNAYLEALEAETDVLRDEHSMRHTKAVENHLRNLSSKAYWSQFDDSVDFVVLYIEVEPAFAMALINNKNLVVDAIRNRVVFATPTTLITLLQTVAFSWKQHKATENAIEIWKTAKEIYERLLVFTEHFQRLGQNIDGLSKTYNQSVGSWENRVMPGIRKLENLGIGSEKKQRAELENIETPVRELKAVYTE